MKSLRIGQRTVGPGLPVLIVAEIGVNHDGSIDRAIELARVAANCGADAVKFQIFRAAALMHPSSAMAVYQKRQCADNDAISMLRRFELSFDEMRELVCAIDEMEMLPLATPFSPDDVDVIEKLSLPAIKIASPDLVNRVLLDRCAKSQRPLLVSTGAATMEEVSAAVEWFRAGRAEFALLHCVSSYPTPANQAHLGWIEELKRFDVPVGFSDHTTEPIVGALAVAAGAALVEKHLTYDRAAPGPDHAASADPDRFDQYVRQIRMAEPVRGRAGKRVLPCEQEVRNVSRQSLVLTRDVESGSVISDVDLTVQRPGTGISPAAMTQAVGRRVRRTLRAGTMLQWDMLSDAA
jgi:N-acetylneuraminate synthase/N,N'-diacetyllegionaminate synthase